MLKYKSKYHYLVIGEGRWSQNYRRVLKTFDDVQLLELKCDFHFEDIILRLHEICSKYPQAVLVFACDPIIQTRIISEIQGLNIAVIIEKPLSFAFCVACESVKPSSNKPNI